MSYSNPNRRSYSFSAIDFGAGDSSHAILGPAGKKGTVIGVHVSATEVFNEVTTAGMVLLGTAGDTNAYVQFELGALGATDAADTADGSTDTDAIIDSNLPADTQVEVTFVAPTGGTPTGIADVTVTIDWAN